MVEKIKRDVRITTIYEGTSEIMEWTIARDRWQLHLKSRGAFYLEWAAKLDAQQAASPDDGAATAAMALRVLAGVLERCRLDRLTRSQHVLFRLGRLIALAEAAAVFAERVSRKPTDATPLSLPGRQALARIFARQALQEVTSDGLLWIFGSSAPGAAGFLASLDMGQLCQAAVGLMADMDFASAELNRAFPA